VEELRQAAGFEGLIVLAVIYFVLAQVQRAGKRKPGPPRTPPTPRVPSKSSPQDERLSLQSILREIERVKQQRAGPAPSDRAAVPAYRRPLPRQRPVVVQDERGPLGRLPDTALPAAEEVEETDSLDLIRARGEARALGLSLEEWQRRQRETVDQDDEAEAVVQRRIQAAEARNREHQAADHRAFDERIRSAAAPVAGSTQGTSDRLREAVVWREILGPPKALQD
jgi:hypothetical protein